MAEGEQVRPLAPADLRYAEENGNVSAQQSKQSPSRRRGLLFCSCCFGTTFIIGLITLILALTVFKVKEPEMNINSVKFVGLDVALKLDNTPRSGLNISFISDISIKNPNSASFKFTNATTTIYYGGLVIGEVKNPRGNAKARKTLHMNVTGDILVDTLMKIPRFTSDILSGLMPIGTYTKLAGRVNVLNIVKKHIDIKMNCTMTVVISTQDVTDKKCDRTVEM